jgi:DNA-binding IclR family transcriptional regulator
MNENPGTVKSAVRVLDLLEMLAVAEDQVGVSEIARRLGIPKSSTHMLLATLESRGYVIGDEDRRFRLNPMLNREGTWVGGSSLMLMRLARPAMEALANECSESSFLGVASGEAHVEYIAKVVSQQELRCDADLGKPRPMHSTSVGLVMLAFQREERTEKFFKAGRFERIAPDTITDPKLLQKELALVRERGYALVRDTNSPGASGIAAPVFGANGEVIAALNLSAPTSRFPPIERKALPSVIAAAQTLTRELAGHATQPYRARKSL